jgi:hypothetical protein
MKINKSPALRSREAVRVAVNVYNAPLLKAMPSSCLWLVTLSKTASLPHGFVVGKMEGD